MKTFNAYSWIFCFFIFLVGLNSYVYAGDDPIEGARRARNAASSSALNPMPTLTTGMYGTQTGDPNSGNMGQYLCKDASPIAFTINVPVNPTNRSATLQMAVYDVDGDASNPEVDSVYINSTKVGILNGTNNTYFYDVFNIPQNLLKQGSNQVNITIDDNSGGWCVEVDWAVVSLTGGASSAVQIPRAWISPVAIPSSPASTINIFAEVTGNNITSVYAYYGFTQLAKLIPTPGNTGTYSGQLTIPAGLPPGFYNAVNIKAVDSQGNTANWPGLTIQ